MARGRRNRSSRQTAASPLTADRLQAVEQGLLIDVTDSYRREITAAGLRASVGFSATAWAQLIVPDRALHEAGETTRQRLAVVLERLAEVAATAEAAEAEFTVFLRPHGAPDSKPQPFPLVVSVSADELGLPSLVVAEPDEL